MAARLLDLASEFVEHVIAKSDRREAWNQYERAHPDIFGVYFRNPYWGRRTDLDAALPRFNEIESRLRSLTRVAPSRALRVVESVSDLSEAAHATVVCVLFVGLFGANGFQDTIGGVPTFFIALEKVADATELSVLTAHEAMHAFHASLRSGTWDDHNILHALFSEGLAVHVSRLAIPGRPLEDYLWFRSPLSEYERAFREGVRELLSTPGSPDAYERNFNYDPSRPPQGLPPRFGYYAGTRVLDEIGSHVPVKSLARWSSARAAEATRDALLRFVD